MPENKPLDQSQQDFLNNTGGYSSIQDVLGYAQNSMSRDAQRTVDPYAPGKVTNYPSHALGFDKFYNKTAYRRLGFNPFIDNYDRYKTQTTDWELFLDAQRAHMKMHNNMFSFFDLGGADFEREDIARQYEEIVELGTPIGRDDTYSWALKQYVQAGYTTAIVSSIVAEELALGAATLATRGKAAEAAWARTAKNINRLAHIGDMTGDMRKVKEIYDVGQMSKKASSTADYIRKLKDVSVARAFWDKTKTLTKGAVEGLFPHATMYAKAIKDGTYATNGFANATNAFGAFWRELREFNLAFDESDLEAQFVSKEVMGQLSRAYQEKHGVAPEGEEADKLWAMADSAGKSTALVNSGLIYLTNKIGFNTLFSKFAPRALKENITNTAFGKLKVKSANLKGGRRAYAEFVKSGLRDQLRHYTKKSTLRQAPLSSLKFLSGAALMGTSEGMQEYLQEVIQDAETRRAVDKYKKGLEGSYLNYYADSMNKFISPEGADIFLSGFFMGAFAGPHRFVTSKGADAVHAGMEYVTGNYKKNRQHKNDMQQKYEEQVEKINDMFNKPWSRDVGLGGLRDNVNANAKSAEQDDAIKSGDEKRFRDIKDEATLDVIYNALSKGTFDELIDQVNQMQNLTDEELIEAYQDHLTDDASREELIAFKEDARKIVERAKTIKNLKEDIDRRYINPFSFGAEGDREDTTFGYDPHFMYNAFEYAKKQLVKNNYSYQRTLERQSAILKDFADNPPFWDRSKKGPASDYTVLLNNHDLSQEIDTLEKELESINIVPNSELSPQQEREKRQKRSKVGLLKDMRQQLGVLKSIYFNDSIRQIETEKLKENIKSGKQDAPLSEGARINLKTKAGGKADIIEQDGDKIKIQKENGWIGWINKSSAELDIESIQFEEDTESIEKAVNSLRKSFEKYMEFLASKNDTRAKNDNLDQAFQKLLDFYALNQDGKNLTQVLNTLMNPEGFEDTMLRRAAAEEHIWNNKRTIIEESVKKAMENYQNNFLLQELAQKHKAFLSEEDAEALFENEIEPTEFYDVDTLKPINKTSKRYSDIQEEVEEYMKEKWDGEPEQVVEETEEVVEETTTEEATAPTGPITTSTPFSEWPDILKSKLREAMLKHNEGIAMNKSISKVALKNLTYNDPEVFLNSQAGKIKMAPILATYNKDLEAVEEIEKVLPKKTEAPKEVIIEGEELLNITDEDKDDIETMATSLLQEEGVEIKGPQELLVDINMPLSNTIKDRLVRGEVTLITIDLSPTKTNPILKELKKQGKLKRDETLADATGLVFGEEMELNNETRNVVYIYQGKKSLKELGALPQILKELSLPQEPTDTYTVPIELQGQTYYAENTDQANWLKGEGKQHIFTVGSKVSEKESIDIGMQGMKWEKEVKAKINNADSLDQLALVYKEIVAENIKRPIFMEAADIRKLYEAKKEEITSGMIPENFISGETYELAGKKNKFKFATVVKSSPSEVNFISLTGERFSIKTKALPKMIKRKVTDIEEEIAQQNIELTSEEQEILNQNQKSADEFAKDTASILRTLDKADDMSNEEADNDFFNNLGC